MGHPARLVAARRRSEAVPTQLPRSAAALSIGRSAGAVIERRFVLPHNDGRSTAGEHKSFWLRLANSTESLYNL